MRILTAVVVGSGMGRQCGSHHAHGRSTHPSPLTPIAKGVPLVEVAQGNGTPPSFERQIAALAMA